MLTYPLEKSGTEFAENAKPEFRISMKSICHEE